MNLQWKYILIASETIVEILCALISWFCGRRTLSSLLADVYTTPPAAVSPVHHHVADDGQLLTNVLDATLRAFNMYETEDQLSRRYRISKWVFDSFYHRKYTIHLFQMIIISVCENGEWMDCFPFDTVQNAGHSTGRQAGKGLVRNTGHGKGARNLYSKWELGPYYITYITVLTCLQLFNIDNLYHVSVKYNSMDI